MGRKRKSNKKDLKLSVDKALVEKLVELNINKSALFTDAALRIIEEYRIDDEKEEKEGLE